MKVHNWLLEVLSNPSICEHAAITASEVARKLACMRPITIDLVATERGIYDAASELKIPTQRVRRTRRAV